MVLCTATKDENVPRPRPLIIVLLAIEAELRWQKCPNGNWTPGQIAWKGRSVDVDRSQGRANESTDPVAPVGSETSPSRVKQRHNRPKGTKTSDLGNE